jgi:DNA-binding response OmpR family regulator
MRYREVFHSMSAIPDDPEVLVVDDEEDLADLYGAQLPDTYEVTVAYDGEQALAAIDEATDVVLLDRRMPGLSGDEVLDEIRDRAYNCRVVIVSAVDPDFEISEMPFDDYLCKPVSSADLKAIIEQQLEFRERDERLDEYLELQSKIMLLELEKRADELERSQEYQELKERAQALESEVEEVVDDFEEVRERFDEMNRAA